MCLTKEQGNISKQYKPGDRIILLGYSRGTRHSTRLQRAIDLKTDKYRVGAWAARYLATLIDQVGLPKEGDEDFFHQVYNVHNGSFPFKPRENPGFLDKYERTRHQKPSNTALKRNANRSASCI